MVNIRQHTQEKQLTRDQTDIEIKMEYSLKTSHLETLYIMNMKEEIFYEIIKWAVCEGSISGI